MTEERLPIHQMMEHMELAVRQAFSIEPYLEEVAVVFNWKIGNTDLPFGIMIGRDGQVSKPSSLVGICQQTAKMLKHQAEQMCLMFEAADAFAAELAEKIKKLKGEADAGDSESRKTGHNPSGPV